MRAPPLRLLPSSLYGPARRHLTPGAAGRVPGRHIALTFDDGPDPRSTPAFIDLLARHQVRATFFLVGVRAERHPDVVRALLDAGHELAVHGWTHRCTALLRPVDLQDDLQRTRQLLESLGHPHTRWYRPPYGIGTLSSTAAASRADLTPLLWTAWGRDWTRTATPARIVTTVQRTLRPGGTVLLHDTDAYSSPGSWRRTLAATDELLDQWHESGHTVGPARDHLQPVLCMDHQAPKRTGA